MQDRVQRAEHGRSKDHGYQEPKSRIRKVALLGVRLPWLEVPDLEQEAPVTASSIAIVDWKNWTGTSTFQIIRGAATEPMTLHQNT